MGLAIITFFAFIFRLIGSNQSFWLDEGASISIARLPLANILGAAGSDVHPPLSYLLLHFWLPLAGKSEWLIRFPNILIGTLAIPALYFLLKTIFPKDKNNLPLLASLLLALNPLHIYYSMELRMYSLNALLSIFSWTYLVKALTEKEKNTKSWQVFTLLSLANVYTFYGSFFNLIAQLIYVIYKHRTKLKPFVLSQLLLVTLFLPWLPTLRTQLTNGGILRQSLPGWSVVSGTLSIKSLGLIMAKFILGRISLANKTAYALFVAGVSLYFLLCSVLTYLRRELRPLLIWFYIPVIVATVISLKIPLLGYWRFTFIIPAFVSIVAYGLSNLPKSARNFNYIVVILVFVLGNLIFWTNPVFQREDWRGASQLINEPKSISIVNFPGPFAPLQFYAPNVYYYADQESLGKMRTDLDQSLPLVLKDKQRVFVFDYLSDLSDPKRSILHWLKQAGFKQVKVHNYNSVGFIYEFAPPKI